MKNAILFSVVIILTACAPSAQAVQTAIAKTEAAQTTNTFIPTFLPTSTPTASQTPSPSPTPTLTPTPTPDVRVIIGDAEDYILQPSDFPDEYVLRPGDSSPHLNAEILSVRGQEEGKAYLEATGRIKGWIIWYNRISQTAIAPEWVQSYIVMYKTTEGPAIALGPVWNKDLFEDIRLGKITRLDDKLDLGDENIVTLKREMQPSGEYYVWYTIEFRYRNVLAEILGQGLESDVRPEYIENLARINLRKLQEAPLSSP
jgi:hypothetical protein